MDVFYCTPDRCVLLPRKNCLSRSILTLPAGLQHIVLGEDLDSFPLPATFDQDTQSLGKAANVDAAFPRKEWLRHEYPEEPRPMALLREPTPPHPA